MAVDQLTPDSAEALDGPAWLRAQRVAAASRWATAVLPDTSAEEWRYSRVAEIDLDRFEPVAASTADASAALASVPALGESAGRIVLVDGLVVSVELDETLAARGVRFGRLADFDAAPHEAVDPVDAFGDLTTAHGRDPIGLVVPRGLTVDRPFQVIEVVVTDGALVLPRLVVEAGADSEFRVVQWSASTDGVTSLVIPRTDVHVGPSARVGLASVEAWGRSTHQLGALVAVVDQEATLRMGHVALGGDYARSRFDCGLVGRGATGLLSALYLGDGDQMHDLRTFQRHDARDTTSELLFKGALDDSARAVYTGMIRVDHQGRGTNANQSNRVIKLSDDAWAESVPNLEIHHNDVRCSHATAVGPIDPEQRFYLESRGVPPEAAERLVVNGFFEDVLDTIVVPEVIDAVRPLIAARLGGGR